MCCSRSGRTLCFSVSWSACTVCVWRAFRWCHASHGNHNGDLPPCSLSGRLIVLGLGTGRHPQNGILFVFKVGVHRPRISFIHTTLFSSPPLFCCYLWNCYPWSPVSLQDCSAMWLPGDQWCDWTASVWTTVSVLEAVTVSVFTLAA